MSDEEKRKDCGRRGSVDGKRGLLPVDESSPNMETSSRPPMEFTGTKESIALAIIFIVGNTAFGFIKFNEILFFSVAIELLLLGFVLLINRCLGSNIESERFDMLRQTLVFCITLVFWIAFFSMLVLVFAKIFGG